MLVRRRDRFADLCVALHERVSKLSPAARKALPAGVAPSRALRPWALILAGLCFGALGYSLASREAQLGWLKGHSPPLTLWERTLSERGFVPVRDERTLFEIQGRLPRLGENMQRVHVLGNRRAVYVRTGQETHLFSHGSASPPAFHSLDWEPLGYGWDAFEALLALDFPAVPPAGKRGRRSVHRDPREIQY